MVAGSVSGDTLRYVTTNSGKVHEAQSYLDSDVVESLSYDYTEIQATSLRPIATTGAHEAYQYAGSPVLVDDAGLFIDGFDGFPGPYSAFAENTLGIETIQRVAETELDAPRSASFRCVLGYCDGEAIESSTNEYTDTIIGSDAPPVKLFTGEVSGQIVSPRGDGGFGYDPIFEHNGMTLAERDAADKNDISHRGRALKSFAEWFQTR
ncbi:non-canonical purine NTP pyrophosphatase [Haloquadratum walsbyi]|jgi:dITPase (EC 3.6.1.-)|uniref:Xanthosine triphosphate pyrophosphatase n=1 Tax=Haloquadratum walsbyi J07HQW2 TaxID=1238425 RepID=U1NGQ7_9EURY|nr:MAG: xanthosine triphosphate pyrophosphatase [Haloquadratum walsbyi J07HQW2]